MDVLKQLCTACLGDLQKIDENISHGNMDAAKQNAMHAVQNFTSGMQKFLSSNQQAGQDLSNDLSETPYEPVTWEPKSHLMKKLLFDWDRRS